MTDPNTVEKPPPSPKPKGLALLKTKRAITALALLVIIAVVLIALGATHILTPHHHNSKAIENHIGNNSGNSSSPSNSTGTGNGPTNINGTDPGPGPGPGKINGTDTGNGPAGGNGTANGTTNGNDNTNGNGTTPGPWRPQNSSTIAEGTPLRIMCLGASIVRGERSSDLNGFRKTLRTDLAALGVPINMVGSQRFGSMLDNDEEAYGGNRVSQIHDHATRIVPQLRPNLFVINVGTNNALQNRDVDVAGKDMQAFLDYLLSASPRATIVLSTLLTNTVPNLEPLILDMNQQFRTLFEKYENKSVVLAELHPLKGGSRVPQVADIGPDGSHPTDHGYEIMGHLLADAIKDADSKGYLRWPEENGLAYDGEQGRAGAPDTSTTELPPPKPTN